MSYSVNKVHYGTIICVHCDKLLDVVENEKVTIYYSQCKNKNCHSHEKE